MAEAFNLHGHNITYINENLTARTSTKHGATRQIDINYSIIQGRVISLIKYALLM